MAAAACEKSAKEPSPGLSARATHEACAGTEARSAPALFSEEHDGKSADMETRRKRQEKSFRFFMTQN